MEKIILRSLIVIIGLTIVLGSCSKDEEILELHSEAGNSFLDIENEGYKVSLNAIPAIEGQIGTWRIYMGENGRFDDVNDANTTFYGEPGEKYILGWEVSVGDQYKAATIDVSFKPLNPELDMVVKDTIFNNVSLYLNSIVPKFGAEGMWEIIEGENGRIDNPESANAEFIGVENSNYALRWSLSYGSKMESIDFTFQTDTLRADAGNDRLDIITSKEVVKYTNLNAFLPAGASAEWEVISGETVELLSFEDPSAVLKGIADKEYKLLWKVSLGEYESVDTLKVRFRGKWGMFTDERDGKSYRYAVVNGLQWMADNFDYNAPFTQYGRSWYYGQSSRALIKEGHPVETEEDRKKYGRLYNYFAAVEAAPPGWRLPTRADFEELTTFLGGPQYSYDKIIEGGETGIEISFAGIGSYSNDSATSRDYYSFQDIAGAYWTDYYNPNRFEGIVQIFYSDNPTGGIAPFSAYFSGASVRYIRDDK